MFLAGTLQAHTPPPVARILSTRTLHIRRRRLLVHMNSYISVNVIKVYFYIRLHINMPLCREGTPYMVLPRTPKISGLALLKLTRLTLLTLPSPSSSCWGLPRALTPTRGRIGMRCPASSAFARMGNLASPPTHPPTPKKRHHSPTVILPPWTPSVSMWFYDTSTGTALEQPTVVHCW
jgi:hypothetical protein